MSGVLDAHIHLWELDRVELPWFRPGLGLPETVRLADLAAAAAPLAASPTPVPGPGPGPLTGAIAVQAGASRAEALWLTGMCDPLLAGAVVQYDPADPDGWAVSLVGGPARGMRVAVPDRRADLADVAGLDAACERVAAADGVVEFLVRAEQLDGVAAVLARHPRTRFVLCHLGLGAGDPDVAWERGLRAVAALPNAWAKLSGIATAGDQDGSRLRTAVDVALDAFGIHRLLFGSDWPMSARVAPYPELVRRIGAALPPLTAEAAQGFWGGTARVLYRL
ncbi:amidohydrolase family protein [Leifsonia sp. NPDC080035]|uniref:Amidohydrolase family protein n=1 Tax=Leifsonia sp. NPDC080035 TaxID=3143936 RepID=A0AAU7G6R2_9MICO